MEQKKRHFIRVLDQHHGTIRSLCKVYFHSKEDQKDAFQDVVLQLWKAFNSFQGRSEINTWIYRISLNTIFSKIRKEKKSVVAGPIDEAHFLLSAAGADDSLELLNQILKSLKDVDKALVVLHLEGYKNNEIAEILDLSASNVATRFNRVKSQLQSKFNTSTHEPRKA